MPYSKNPDKYPPEIQALPDLLRLAPEAHYDIRCDSTIEAHGRKTQIQSYFVAVERRAAAYGEIAQRALDRRQKASTLAPAGAKTPAHPTRMQALSEAKDEASDALALAEQWAIRAATVVGWMVKTYTDVGGVVWLQLRRRTTGAFGDSLRAAFGGQQPVPPVVAERRTMPEGEQTPLVIPQSEYEQQMALLHEHLAKPLADDGIKS